MVTRKKNGGATHGAGSILSTVSGPSGAMAGHRSFAREADPPAV